MKKRTSDAQQQNVKNQLQRALDENEHLKGELRAARVVRHSNLSLCLHISSCAAITRRLLEDLRHESLFAILDFGS